MRQFSAKPDNFESFGPNFPKNGFRFGMLEQESASSRYHVYYFSSKTNNFDFFGPSLPENKFRVGNSEN